MKTRLEYEKICDDTFMLAGDAQAARIQVDLLLDIRELLMWFRDEKLLEEIKKQREGVVKSRVSIIYE